MSKCSNDPYLLCLLAFFAVIFLTWTIITKVLTLCKRMIAQVLAFLCFSDFEWWSGLHNLVINCTIWSGLSSHQVWQKSFISVWPQVSHKGSFCLFLFVQNKFSMSHGSILHLIQIHWEICGKMFSAQNGDLEQRSRPLKLVSNCRLQKCLNIKSSLKEIGLWISEGKLMRASQIHDKTTTATKSNNKQTKTKWPKRGCLLWILTRQAKLSKKNHFISKSQQHINSTQINSELCEVKKFSFLTPMWLWILVEVTTKYNQNEEYSTFKPPLNQIAS